MSQCFEWHEDGILTKFRRNVFLEKLGRRSENSVGGSGRTREFLDGGGSNRKFTAASKKTWETGNFQNSQKTKFPRNSARFGLIFDECFEQDAHSGNFGGKKRAVFANASTKTPISENEFRTRFESRFAKPRDVSTKTTSFENEILTRFDKTEGCLY